MNISLSPDGEFLVVKLKYHPDAVRAVKSVTGATYNPVKKLWTVPLPHVEEALETLSRAGSTADPEVIAAAKKQKEKRLELQAIKNGAKKDGAEVFSADNIARGDISDLPLFNFQKIGCDFLWSATAALLADEPGLGKTIQTIAALSGPSFSRNLVLCPATLKYNWQEEIKKWRPNELAAVVSGSPKKRQEFWKKPAKWIIANYELLIKDIDIIRRIPWTAIVCDEATRISNPRAKSVKALKWILCPKKIALTGTPISNSPIDLWSIADWLRPGFLGSYWQFLESYTIRDRWNNIVGYKNLGVLAQKIEPLTLRRVKEEVLTDFPNKTREDVVFSLSAPELKVYESVKTRLLEEIRPLLSKIDTRSLALIPVKMLRLKQITGHLRLIGEGERSSKLEVLKQLLEPILKSGEKALIFTQFAEMAKILYEELKNFHPFLIYGEVEQAERQARVNAFSAFAGPAVMIMTEAGAYGLNLQAAPYVFHYDLPWSVAKLTQREDRAHRIGQTKPVTVYNLVARHTIDEYVSKVLHKKQKISSDILQDAERLEKSGLAADDVKAILGL